MNVARVDATSDFRVTGREVLFTLRPEYIGFSTGDGGDDLYDISSDDQRFLMGRVVGGGETEDSQRLILVQNFFEELRERVSN